MQGWIATLTPRQHGLTIVLGASVLVALNLAVSRRYGSYYPLLFPMAGFIAPMGVYMLASGFGADDFRAHRVPRWQLTTVYVVMFVSAAAGLYANQMLFGSPF